MSLIIIGLAVAAAVAIGVAFYKHKTLAAVEASAKKEAAYLKTAAVAEAQNLEALASKVEADAKIDYASMIVRLKALGL